MGREGDLGFGKSVRELLGGSLAGGSINVERGGRALCRRADV